MAKAKHIGWVKLDNGARMPWSDFLSREATGLMQSPIVGIQWEGETQWREAWVMRVVNPASGLWQTIEVITAQDRLVIWRRPKRRIGKRTAIVMFSIAAVVLVLWLCSGCAYHARTAYCGPRAMANLIIAQDSGYDGYVQITGKRVGGRPIENDHAQAYIITPTGPEPLCGDGWDIWWGSDCFREDSRPVLENLTLQEVFDLHVKRFEIKQGVK